MGEGTVAPRAEALGHFSWAFYEWARNPIWIVVAIYIFGPYFSSQIVGDPVQGQALWGTINATAGIVIAALAPFLGAMADKVGRRKPWIISMTLFMAGAGFVLWYALPNDGGIGILGAGLAMIVISVGFEFSAVFHNSMLPTIARDNKLASLSGLGLALGNMASLLVLIFMLVTIMLAGSGLFSFLPDVPWFGLDTSQHEHSRISGPLTALWLLVFTVPLVLYTPDTPRSSVRYSDAFVGGARDVWRTVRSLRHYKNIGTYLLARMLYNDGKTAVIAFGGVYAAGIFGWGALELTMLGIVLSTFAVAGGFVGGWLDNAFGSKRAIQISILGTSLGTVLAVSMTPHSILFMEYATSEPVWDGLMFQTLPELCYIGVVILIAIFITAAYANSRTMLARIAPEERMSQFFGLYALSGTATAFFGHGLVAFLTSYYDSQRIGFAGVLVLLLGGFFLMSWVTEERSVVAD